MKNTLISRIHIKVSYDGMLQVLSFLSFGNAAKRGKSKMGDHRKIKAKSEKS
jgi:hypothetical protein